MKTFRRFVAEKAPPGDKYERMVKHIKATGAPKNVAFATAWKHYNKKHKLEENKEQKTIKKYVKKKQKEGNAKAAAYRKLYAKLGYKGNPGNYDLDEGILSDLAYAAKEGIKDPVGLAAIAAPVPGSAAYGAYRIIKKAKKAWDQKRKLASA